MATRQMISYDPVFEGIKQAREGGQALLAGQKEEQLGAIDNFSDLSGSQESLVSVFNRAQEERGIDDIRGAINTFTDQTNTVQGLLNSLDDDIDSRTRGTFTTESQRNRQIAAEGEDLRGQLGDLGSGLNPLLQNYQFLQNDVGQVVDLTYQDQQKQLEPLRMKMEVMPDRFAREITGYNQDKENELSALFSKLQREQSLADQEFQRLQQLEAESRAFEREKQLFQLQAQHDLKLQQQANAAPAWADSLMQSLMDRSGVNAETQRILGGGQVENFMLDSGLDFYEWQQGGEPMSTRRYGNEYVSTGQF